MESNSWKLRLSNALNTKPAHYISLSLILLSFLISLASLLLAVFSCEDGTTEHPQVKSAEAIMRWIDVALLAVMFIEIIARVLLMGFLSHFNSFVHIFDAVIVVTLLVVQFTIAATATAGLLQLQLLNVVALATSSAGLFIALRVLPIVRLLSEVDLLSEAREEELLSMIRVLQSKVEELEKGKLNSKNSDCGTLIVWNG
jgi:hypothetical protein